MLRAFKVTWLVVGFVLAGNLSVVQAQTTTQPAEATKFVEALTERVSGVLARYEQGSESDRQALTQLAEEAFALDVVSRFVLGPTWQQASPAQQQEFQRVFSQWMVGVYGRRLGASKGGAMPW